MAHTVPISRRRAATARIPKPTPKQRAFAWNQLARQGHTGFTELFAMPSLDRAVLVKKGAPSVMVGIISKEMDISRERFVRILGLPRATVTRKMANKTDLSADESERLVGLAKLIGQVEAMVSESGTRDGFKPAKWFGEWIAQPVPALGGRKPEEFLDTSDGREAVGKILAQMQSSAYA